VAPLIAGGAAGTECFNLYHLVSAVQAEEFNVDRIGEYMSYYKRDLPSEINDEVIGFPSIFYAVASDNEQVVRLWAEHGANINTVHRESGTPLLAFAIFNAERMKKHTTRMVSMLLGLGASPKVIPMAFYSPFDQDLPENGQVALIDADLEHEDTKWCAGEEERIRLCRTLNLTQRYYLERAVKSKKTSTRQAFVARRKGAENLLGVQYFLIGQETATRALKTKLLTHLTLPGRRPLVLVFAGKLLVPTDE
jgi:hypothetical protein